MSGQGQEEGRYTVRAVMRVLDILDLLQDSTDGVSLTEVSRAVDLPKSSAFRYLATLESRGYVAQDRDSGVYRFGLALLPSHTLHLQSLGIQVEPFLRDLRDRFQETINFAVLDGTRIAYLQIVESKKSMRLAARVSDRTLIHSSALGKAIAAGLSDDEVLDILRAEGMPRRTSNTITDEQAYLAELTQVRQRGYALDDEEYEVDGRCVAVSMAAGRVRAAISLSAPASRFPMKDVEAVADALNEVAAVVKKQLGTPWLKPIPSE